MIAAGKQHEQVSKITATGIAQPSDILDTSKRIMGVVSYREFALGYGAADERAGSLTFDNQSSLVAAKVSHFVGIIIHIEPSKSVVFEPIWYEAAWVLGQCGENPNKQQ